MESNKIMEKPKKRYIQVNECDRVLDLNYQIMQKSVYIEYNNEINKVFMISAFATWADVKNLFAEKTGIKIQGITQVTNDSKVILNDTDVISNNPPNCRRGPEGAWFKVSFNLYSFKFN